jgi:hypothetical protein
MRSQEGSLKERATDEKLIRVANEREGDYQRNRERQKQRQIGILRSAW